MPHRRRQPAEPFRLQHEVEQPPRQETHQPRQHRDDFRNRRRVEFERRTRIVAQAIASRKNRRGWLRGRARRNGHADARAAIELGSLKLNPSNTMYKIIGADGKEYGPIPTETLKQWHAEGRVNAQTQVLPDGATQWQALGTIPELAASLPLTSQPSAAPSAANVAAATDQVN